MKNKELSQFPNCNSQSSIYIFNRNFHFKIFLSLIIVIIIFPNLSAQDNLELNARLEKELSLAPFISLNADNGKKLKIEDAIELFEKNIDIVPFGNYVFPDLLFYHKHYFWLKFELKNNLTIPQTYLIKIPEQDSIVLFQYDKKELERKSVFGKLTYIKDRPSQELNGLNSSEVGLLKLKPNKAYTFYVRLSKNVWKFNKPIITLAPTDQYIMGFYKNQLDYYLVSALFLGAIGFMGLFFLFQYFKNKEKTYLYYCLYLLMIFLYYWRVFDFVSSIHPQFFGTYFFGYAMTRVPLDAAIYISYFLFVQYFFKIKGKYQPIDKYAKYGISVFLIYTLISIVLSFYSIPLVYFIHIYFRIALAVFALFFFSQLTKINHPLKFWILLGSLFLLVVSGIAPTLVTFIWGDELHIGAIDIPNFIAQFGILMETLCFSMALVTKSVKTESDLQFQEQRAKNLQELEAFKTQVFTNIAHDLRIPLTSISNLTTELQELNFKGNIQNKLNGISHHSNKIIDFTDQILELAKLDAGKLPTEFRQMDAIPFLRYLVESFRSSAQSKKINLNFSSSKTSLLMDMDEQKIDRIISNLISNAIKFTEEHGKILVEVQTIEKDGLAFIEIKITDNGIGISPDDLPHIFDLYFRSENNKHINGMGIGLALVKKMVELLGGKIKVIESRPYENTVFQLLLPITNIAPLKNDTPDFSDISKKQIPVILSSVISKKQTSDSKKPTLLIVEDDESITDHLVPILEKDYQIEVASNGIHGLKKVQTYPPDLIICDVVMPWMDGFSFCRTLRKNMDTAHIPFLLISSKVDNTSRVAGFQAGANAYLEKPFQKEILLTQIKSQLAFANILKNKYLENSGFNIVNDLLDFCKNNHAILEDKKGSKCQISLIQLANSINSKPTYYSDLIKLVGFSLNILLTYFLKKNIIDNKNIDIHKILISSRLKEDLAEIKFLREAFSVVEKNIGDTTFGVRELAIYLQEKSVHRSTLNNKLKTILGITPSHFIHLIRIDKAKILLEEKHNSYKAVAKETGFKNEKSLIEAYSEFEMVEVHD